MAHTALILFAHHYLVSSQSLSLFKMESSSTSWISIAISLTSVLVVTLLWAILDWVWFKPKKLEKCLKQQGFNGNPYKFFYGNNKDTAQMLAEERSKPMAEFSHDHLKRALPFVHYSVNKYGKRCIIWNGPIPHVYIAEPELVRELLTRINDFEKQKSNPFIKVIAPGLFQLEGKEWANRRKLLTPAFHMEKLKFMLPAFFASCNDMLKKWEELATFGTGSCEVDAWSYFHKLSADVISRAAFGSSYKEGKRVFELISEQLVTAIPVVNSVYIPGWRFVPTRTNKRIMEMEKEMRALLKGIIHKRKNAINAGQEEPKDDLLGILLQSSNFSEIHHEKQENEHKLKYNGLSLKEVIDECKIFYLAGQETTSSLLVWTLILLAKHQDWQSRAREEVLAAFGNHTPDFHGLNHLKMVNMILQEVLRLYPPVTQLGRTVTKDIKVGDIFLPAGVQVNLPVLLIQQDETLWGVDAKEFKPERFAEGISKAAGGNMSFFSFGWGPRICIGSNFAMIEAKMALALILQRFSFHLSPSYAHAPNALSTFRPQFGAQIILKLL